MDQINLQIRFTITDENGVAFNDALYIPLDEYFTLTPQQIADAKQARFDNWKALVEAQSQQEGEPEEVEQGEE